MMKWSIKTIPLEYKFNWAISRASMSRKTGYFVQVESEGITGTGEVAGISKGSGETDFISEFNEHDFSNVAKPEDVYGLEISPPLRFGMESALIHWQSKKSGKPVWEMFNLSKPQNISTSISIPILPVADVADFIQKYNFNRFSYCKVKVGGQHPVESVQEVAKHFRGPLRVDANESFNSAEEVMDFLGKIDVSRLQFLEQPMPGELVGEYKKLKKVSPVPIVADESIQSDVFGDEIADQFHGINVKMMKAGSYKRALEQLRKAKQLGLKTMIGCMVETTLGISSAMNIAEGVDWLDLDGFLIIKEDPFLMVKEENGKLNPA